ncbi:unnamed protein product [Ilex paraguariensis]|uniref:Uncharacterized protein n=1 Tax=Ilex paraguariensis TaxID=185542 RepID=A0ABC8SXI3_9AQUA
MEAKPSTSSSCSCFHFLPSPPHPPAREKSTCCNKVIEFACSACLLCVCCPISAVWCCMKQPCKIGRILVQHARHNACCGLGKRIHAAYTSFSDIDSDVDKGKGQPHSKSLGSVKNRMTQRELDDFKF